MTRPPSTFLLVTLGMLCLGSLAFARGAPPPLSLESYYRYDQLEPLLRRYTEAYPKLTSLRSIGKSREGRELWVMEICDSSTGPSTEKAAMYIQANIHGNEIQGTEVCLYTMDHVLRHYGDHEFATGVLEHYVLLIAPCVNPDGRVHFMEKPNTPHSSRFNLRPTDDDLDGAADEDGFEDLDGDGEVLMMRRKRQGGRMKLGQDPRVLLPAEPDEEGGWELLGPEGLDNDGDGRVNEDPIGGVDLNRNFPINWAPEHIQPGAGPFPLSEPETRAIVEYLRGWPNLAGVQDYHNYGEMILRPPGASTDEAVQMPPEDLALYDSLGRLGEDLLPGYRYLQTHDDLYRVHGGFLDYGYLGLGVVFFTNGFWDFPGDLDKDGEVTEHERLRWNDLMLDGAAFSDWEPFEHPTLGKVEIGGWRPMTRRIPPAFQLREMCHRNMRFSLLHAQSMPRLEVVEIDVKHLSERLHSVDVTVVNKGRIPTYTHMAERLQVAPPDAVSIEGKRTTALGSGRIDPETGEAELERHSPAEVRLGRVEGQSTATVRFLVEGYGKAKVTIRSQKGGNLSRPISLNAPLRD